MAHYDEIRRKSVVNSCLGSRKANKIKGLLVQGLHRREEQNISNACTVRQEHDETVDAVADAARRRHTELQRVEEILIGMVCFVVACFSRSVLCSESLTLVDRIVEL